MRSVNLREVNCHEKRSEKRKKKGRIQVKEVNRTHIMRQFHALSTLLASFAGNSRKVFIFALFSGITFSFFSLFFIHDIYRDVANVYAYYAREISYGNWSEGWVGRVPMLNILLSGILAKFRGIEAYKACVVISSLFYVLTLFPLRSLLNRYIAPVWSAWGCVLFIYAPKIIRFSVCGLIDSSRYFFLILCLLYFFRIADKQFKRRNSVILGLALAGLSVSRGEGFPIAIAILTGLPLFFILQQWKQNSKYNFKKYCAGYLLTWVIFAAGLMPFSYANLKFYHVFAPDLRFYEFFQSKINPPSTTTADINASLEIKEKISEKLLGDVQKTLRGGYELYLLLAVIGACILLCRRKWNYEFSVLIICFTVHFLIYTQVISAYRYSIYLIPLFMPFTMTAIEASAKFGKTLFLRRFSNGADGVIILLAIGVISLLILQTINGLACVTDRKDVPFRKTADFIRDYASKHFPGRRVVVASTDCSIAVYWSGAVALWGYKQYELPENQRYSTNFDLYLLARKNAKNIPDFYDSLQEIKPPEDLPIRIFRKKEK